jgi:hypothetical protein
MPDLIDSNTAFAVESATSQVSEDAIVAKVYQNWVKVRTIPRSQANGGKMEKKQIAYHYGGKIKEDETEIDMDGDKPVPERGQVLLRPDGKRWKVEAVMTRHDGGGALPIHAVFLAPE